jgi:hypothetical protein
MDDGERVRQEAVIGAEREPWINDVQVGVEDALPGVRGACAVRNRRLRRVRCIQ